MYDFDFYRAETLPEALDLLERIPDARVVGGGTDLMVLMKDRLVRPTALISLDRLKHLEGIQADDDGWIVGSMTRLWRLERSQEFGRTYGALQEAIRHLATPPIRNQATLGGNICLDTKCIYYNQSRAWERDLPICLKAGGDVCHVAPAARRCVAALASETVGPLMLYRAELTLTSREGQRRIPLRALYTGDGLAPRDMTRGEVLAQVHLSPPPPRFGVAYRRFSYRKALEFSQFNLSAAIHLDDRGEIASARLVAGAIGPAPVELTQSASSLVGQYPSEARLRETARQALREAVRLARSPRLTPYLQQVLEVYAERLLKEALDRAQADGPGKRT